MEAEREAGHAVRAIGWKGERETMQQTQEQQTERHPVATLLERAREESRARVEQVRAETEARHKEAVKRWVEEFVGELRHRLHLDVHEGQVHVADEGSIGLDLGDGVMLFYANRQGTVKAARPCPECEVDLISHTLWNAADLGDFLDADPSHFHSHSAGSEQGKPAPLSPLERIGEALVDYLVDQGVFVQER